MINSTMKVVRPEVLEAYQDRLEAMYAEDGHNHRNEANRRVIRSLLWLEYRSKGNSGQRESSRTASLRRQEGRDRA